MPQRQALTLKIVIVSPDPTKRAAVEAVLSAEPRRCLVTEIQDYAAAAKIRGQARDWDVAILDLDYDEDLCLAAAQRLSVANSSGTVMVCSAKEDPELLKRAMWAGAREFLKLPLAPQVLSEALQRAAERKKASAVDAVGGRILAFLGAKGGVGVTTLATNFALAVREEAGTEALLADFDLELGDAALLLGLTPRYTLLDVLRNAQRLDLELLTGMLARHESGLAVLAGPDEWHGNMAVENGDLRKLLYLMTARFAFVVVDVGLSLGKSREALFESADRIYLVTQVDITGLRNTHRLLAHMERYGRDKVRVVLNRYDPRRQEITEEHVAKAIGAPVSWKIPNDYSAVRRSHNTGAPLFFTDSAVARVIRQMAREACGKPPSEPAKKGLRLFG